jgi:formate hydrogenlyase subunit 3/multisubunit Na+/H+ antiporter MnhD subunit
MSEAVVSGLMGALVISPACFAVLLLAAGRIARPRKVIAVTYAAVTGAVAVLLLHGFLQLARPARWGALSLTWFSLLPVISLSLISVPALLYVAYTGRRGAVENLPCALVPASCSLAIASFMVEGLAAFVVLWVAVSICALVSLLSGGKAGARGLLSRFAPWIVSDLLLVVAAVFIAAWLREGVLLIEPPITAGGEAQVTVISVLLLAAAGIRLGLFPVGLWTGRLMKSAEPSWNAWFLGAVNFLMAGFLLVAAGSFVARLVASDWSMGLAFAGLLTVVAGPIIALREGRVSGVLSGLYTMQGGLLLLGISFYSRIGIEGALFNLTVSPLFLAAVMMAAGDAEEVAGTGELGKRRIQAAGAPAAFAGMLIAGMSICGLPPLDGFVGKAAAVAGSLDATVVGGFYALAAAGIMMAAGLAVASVVRMVAGIFRSGGARGPQRTTAAPGSTTVRGLSLLSLCGASLLFGLFPDVLWRNVISRASVMLYPRGFSGPGVVFRGTGEAATRAAGYYLSWAQEPAAFILAVAALAALAYFINRSRLRSSVEGP